MDQGIIRCQFVRLKAVINGVLEAKLILPVPVPYVKAEPSVQADTNQNQEERKMAKKPMTKKKGSRGGK